MTGWVAKLGEHKRQAAGARAAHELTAEFRALDSEIVADANKFIRETIAREAPAWGEALDLRRAVRLIVSVCDDLTVLAHERMDEDVRESVGVLLARVADELIATGEPIKPRREGAA